MLVGALPPALAASGHDVRFDPCRATAKLEQLPIPPRSPSGAVGPWTNRLLRSTKRATPATACRFILVGIRSSIQSASTAATTKHWRFHLLRQRQRRILLGTTGSRGCCTWAMTGHRHCALLDAPGPGDQHRLHDPQPAINQGPWRLEAGAHDLVPLVHAGGQHHGGASDLCDRINLPVFAHLCPGDPPHRTYGGRTRWAVLNFLSGKCGGILNGKRHQGLGSRQRQHPAGPFFSASTRPPGGQQGDPAGADGLSANPAQLLEGWSPAWSDQKGRGSAATGGGSASWPTPTARSSCWHPVIAGYEAGRGRCLPPTQAVFPSSSPTRPAGGADLRRAPTWFLMPRPPFEPCGNQPAVGDALRASRWSATVGGWVTP